MIIRLNWLLTYLLTIRVIATPVGEGIMFLECMSVRRVRLFVRIDLSYHDISWTTWAISMKVIDNIHQPLLMIWLALEVGDERERRHPHRRLGDGVYLLVKILVCTLFSRAVRVWKTKIFISKSQDVVDTCRDILSCLPAELVVANRRCKFLDKISLSENKLCSIFVANAVKELSEVRQG